MLNGFRALRILKQAFEFQPISNVALVCDNNSQTHTVTIKTLVSQHDVRFPHWNRCTNKSRTKGELLPPSVSNVHLSDTEARREPLAGLEKEKADRLSGDMAVQCHLTHQWTIKTCWWEMCRCSGAAPALHLRWLVSKSCCTELNVQVLLLCSQCSAHT